MTDLVVPDVMTTREVAILLRTSPKQVRRLPIPCVSLGARTTRYLRKDVLEYLESLAKPYRLRRVG